jgi:hypothetical protein
MAAAGSALRLAERLAQRVGGLTEAQTEELGRALVDCGLGEAALETAQARLAPPSVPASAGAAQAVQELTFTEPSLGLDLAAIDTHGHAVPHDALAASVIVTGVRPGSQAAGLSCDWLPGATLVELNGEPVAGLTFNELVANVRAKGRPLKLAFSVVAVASTPKPEPEPEPELEPAPKLEPGLEATSSSPGACWICTEGSNSERGPLLQPGCGCAQPQSSCHLGCVVDAARIYHERWRTCAVCGQSWSGALAVRLARAHYADLNIAGRPIDDPERLAVGVECTVALAGAGEHQVALELGSTLLEVRGVPIHTVTTLSPTVAAGVAQSRQGQLTLPWWSCCRSCDGSTAPMMRRHKIPRSFSSRSTQRCRRSYSSISPEA